MLVTNKTKLRLDISTNGSLANDSSYIPQPERITNISLKKHQLQTIHGMSMLENNQIKISSDDILVTEIGILSNKVGSGKSLCVLGLIATKPRLDIQSFVSYHFNDSAFIMNQREYMCIRLGNLIVVPNHLVSMWEDYLEKYTSFKYIVIKKQMFPLDWKEVEAFDVVVCTALYYNMLVRSCPWTWSRVIFDESDSINIPACAKPNTRFVWFVSSSLNNLLFCNGHFWKCDEHSKLTRVVTRGITQSGYIKSTFKRLESTTADRILPSIVVKMNNSYIDDHLRLPPVHQHVVKCQDPICLTVLNHAVSEHMTMLLNADDTFGVLDYLGCPVDTKDNIISYICKTFHIQVKNLEMKISYLQNIESVDTDNVSEKIEKTRAKIAELNLKLSKIHEKIDDLIKYNAIDAEQMTDHCPICMESTDLCMFTCCLNVFCKACVNKMNDNHIRVCPLCRGEWEYNQMIFQTWSPNTATDNLNKYEETLKLIKEKLTVSKNQVLVFMWNENTLNKLKHILQSHHIPFRTIAGNTHTIRRIVQWFDEGKIRVLLVNATVHGCGLNLVRATDIILFQKMHVELQNQLMGRAYRIGRTNELNVYRMMHSNEIV